MLRKSKGAGRDDLVYQSCSFRILFSELVSDFDGARKPFEYVDATRPEGVSDSLYSLSQAVVFAIVQGCDCIVETFAVDTKVVSYGQSAENVC